MQGYTPANRHVIGAQCKVIRLQTVSTTRMHGVQPEQHESQLQRELELIFSSTAACILTMNSVAMNHATATL
jgi:hypothetical protein